MKSVDRVWSLHCFLRFVVVFGLSALLIPMVACSKEDDDDDNAGAADSGTPGGTDSGSDDEPLGSFSDQVHNAATFLDDAIPDFAAGANLSPSFANGSAGPIDAPLSFLQGGFITPAIWDDPSGLFPPGGSVQSDDPQYNGVDLPSNVTWSQYIQMSLDSNFARSSGEGGTFKPTVFGRFDQLTDILGYIAEAGITADANTGAYDVGTYNGVVSTDRGAVTIDAIVTATTDTTYYDRAIYVIGYADENSNGTQDAQEQTLVRTIIMARTSATDLNFMSIEDKSERNEFGVSVLKWSRDTGEYAFESVSDSSDSEESNLEVFRAYVTGSDGGEDAEKTWIYAFAGKADSNVDSSNNEVFQWGLFNPTGTAEQGTISIFNVRPGGDIWRGNLCATFATAAAIAGDPIPEDPDPDGGGTCPGQISDALNIKTGIMGMAGQIRGNTTWMETADSKGFPASDHPGLSSQAAIDAWLVAAELVSVSFSGRASFITNFDGTP